MSRGESEQVGRWGQVGKGAGEQVSRGAEVGGRVGAAFSRENWRQINSVYPVNLVCPVKSDFVFIYFGRSYWGQNKKYLRSSSTTLM